VDPLHPITPGVPPLPSRRVAAVDRLRRITREGDRPERDSGREREHRDAEADPPEEEPGEGRIDIRV
jgi:hypothetical protein